MRASLFAHLGSTLLLTGLGLGLFACGDDEETPPIVEPLETDIELVGSWDSAFGTTDVITAAKWGTTDIRDHDNAANWAVVQSPADDAFSANQFAKYVWTTPAADRSFYYCTVDFGLDTLDAAKNTTKVADASSPDTGGCGAFPWTKLFVPLEIKGSYTSMFGLETITSTTWNGTPIRAFDNGTNFAVTQNPADSDFGADLYNKIVWTEPSSGSFYYCFVDFGLATLEQARTSTQTADETDPDNGGCGMFAWTKLSK